MAKGVKHYFKTGKVYNGGYHKMPNGQLHSGKTHGKTSQRLFHYRELSKSAKEVAKKSWGK
jgi:hypothetical protein